jgi:hypothetical protein
MYAGHNTNSTTGPSSSVTVSSSLIPPGGGTPVPITAGLVLLFGMQGGTSGSTLTPPAGFTQVPNCAQQITGNVGEQALWYKITGASEPSSYTASSSSNDFQTGFIVALSGRNTSAPFTAEAATAQQFGTSPVTLTTNPVAAAAGDDVVICGGNRYYDNYAITYAAPSGFYFGNIFYAAVQYSPAAFSCVYQSAPAGTVGYSGGTLTTADPYTQGASVYVVSVAAATAGTTSATQLAGSAYFGFEGAAQVPDYSQSVGYGSFVFTGQASRPVQPYGGILTPSPDFIVTLPYRLFTVVLP